MVWNAVARQSTLSITSSPFALGVRQGDVLDVDDAIELTDAVEELRDLVKLALERELHRNAGKEFLHHFVVG